MNSSRGRLGKDGVIPRNGFTDAPGSYRDIITNHYKVHGRS